LNLLLLRKNLLAQSLPAPEAFSFVPIQKKRQKPYQSYGHGLKTSATIKKYFPKTLPTNIRKLVSLRSHLNMAW
jgi:hypothetical protein